jgi:hypothetical protein
LKGNRASVLADVFGLSERMRLTAAAVTRCDLGRAGTAAGTHACRRTLVSPSDFAKMQMVIASPSLGIFSHREKNEKDFY